MYGHGLRQIYCSYLPALYLAQASYVFSTFTLSGTPTDVMVSADCFRGLGEQPVRGLQYANISAPKAKDKLALLQFLDVLVCKEPFPEPNDDERRCVPESTLRPTAPKPKSGELADFLSDEVEKASQGSKGSKGA